MEQGSEALGRAKKGLGRAKKGLLPRQRGLRRGQTGPGQLKTPPCGANPTLLCPPQALPLTPQAFRTGRKPFRARPPTLTGLWWLVGSAAMPKLHDLLCKYLLREALDPIGNVELEKPVAPLDEQRIDVFCELRPELPPPDSLPRAR